MPILVYFIATSKTSCHRISLQFKTSNQVCWSEQECLLVEWTWIKAMYKTAIKHRWMFVSIFIIKTTIIIVILYHHHHHHHWKLNPLVFLKQSFFTVSKKTFHTREGVGLDCQKQWLKWMDTSLLIMFCKSLWLATSNCILQEGGFFVWSPSSSIHTWEKYPSVHPILPGKEWQPS